MPGDSISTFLDITATRAAPSLRQRTDSEVVRRAEALAGISDGITSVDALVMQTELSKDVAQGAVQWLSENGLVNIRSHAGGVELSLTPAAKSALE